MIDKQINRGEKNSKIANTILGIFFLGIFLTAFLIYPYISKKMDDDFKKNGEKTDAVLLKAEETGNVHNNNPEMKITFKVTSKNGESWEATTEEYFPASQYYLLVPGTVFKVVYNLKDKTKILIYE